MNLLRGKLQIFALILGAVLVLMLAWFLLFGMRERMDEPDGVLVEITTGSVMDA